MIIVPGSVALGNVRKNAHAQWCSHDVQTPGANPLYAACRLATDTPELRFVPKFALEAQQTIYAIGSCFARELEKGLAARGYSTASFDPSVMFTELFRGPNFWDTRTYLNRYTLGSMLREIDNLLDINPLGENELLCDSAGKLHELHYGAGLIPGNHELVAARRTSAKRMGSAISQADIIVITLGLIEAWFDTESDAYMHEAPPTHLLRRGDRFQLRLLHFSENLAMLEEIYAKIKSANPSARFLSSVSPVPMLTTFTNDDVIVANMRSKSILRSVADAFVIDKADAAYFPSYERVMYGAPAFAWKPDRRHVSDAMVGSIIDEFFDSYMTTKPRIVDLSSWQDIDVINVPRATCEFAAGEIGIHPTGGGGTTMNLAHDAAACFRAISTGPDARFECVAFVAHARSAPVAFSIAVADSSTGTLIAHVDSTVSALERAVLTLPFEAAGPVDVILSTRMASPESPTDFAWAQFLAPRIV